MSKEKINPFDILKWGATIAAFYIGIKTIKGLGLLPSKESNLNENIESKNYTSPNFWKIAPPVNKLVVLLTTNAVNTLIKDIWRSVGFFNDCEECIIGVFKQLNYKTQYSYLAQKFYEQKGKDLTAFLKEHFNDKELYPIWKHLDNLPTYKNK